MIKVKRTVLTPAQIFASFTVAHEVLPAPPANKTNVILAITEQKTFNTVNYDDGAGGNVNGRYYSPLGFVLFNSGNTLSSPFNTIYGASPISQKPITTDSALKYTTDVQAANGNSNVIVDVIYEEKTPV